MNPGIARGKFFTQRPSKRGNTGAKDTVVVSADSGSVAPTYAKAEPAVSGAGSMDNPPVNVKNIIPGGGDIAKFPALFGGVPLTGVYFDPGSGTIRVASITGQRRFFSAPADKLTVVWLKRSDHSTAGAWRGVLNQFDFDGRENDESVFMIMVRRYAGAGAADSMTRTIVCSNPGDGVETVSTTLSIHWGIHANMGNWNSSYSQFAVSSRQRLDATVNTVVGNASTHYGWNTATAQTEWYHCNAGALLFGPSIMNVGDSI